MEYVISGLGTQDSNTRACKKKIYIYIYHGIVVRCRTFPMLAAVHVNILKQASPNTLDPHRFCTETWYKSEMPYVSYAGRRAREYSEANKSEHTGSVEKGVYEQWE